MGDEQHIRQGIVKILEDSNVKVTKLELFKSGRGPSQTYFVEDTFGKQYVCKVPKEVEFCDDSVIREIDKQTSTFAIELYRAPREEIIKNSFKLESMVLDLWEKRNLPSVKRYAVKNPNLILLDRIQGIDYKELVDSENFDRNQHLIPLIDTLYEIRGAALLEKNPLLLYNDMHLGNVLYDEKSRKAIAIDPGLPLNSNFSFGELDAGINLFFCYSLMSPYFFRKNATLLVRKEILGAFLESINGESLHKMSLNTNVSSSSLDYRMKHAPKKDQNLRNATYSAENQNYLKEEIAKHLIKKERMSMNYGSGVEYNHAS